MSWSKPLTRLGFIVLTLGTPIVLSACTLTPVYSGAMAESPSMNLAFAKPRTRLEQIIYQDLSFRLGSTDSATAPLVTVSVSSSAGDMTLSATSNPSKPVEVFATATMTITPRDGSDSKVQTITRKASATYTRNSQVLADKSAEIEAAERAAKAVAESLRLAVLAERSR